MRYSRRRLNEVADIKQTAVERIRTAIGQIDTSPSHKYIQDFATEFSSFEKVSDSLEILNEACSSNLIWIGDYHALSRFQQFAAEFVRELYKKKPNIGLGVEP